MVSVCIQCVRIHNDMQMDVIQSNTNDFIITKNISIVKTALHDKIHTQCFLMKPIKLPVDVFLSLVFLMCSVLIEGKHMIYGFS